MAGVDIQLHLPNLSRYTQLMRQATPEAQRAVIVQMVKDTEPYVPARTKSLSLRTQINDDTIVYPGPYARFLYHGKVMIDPVTKSPYARYGAHKIVTAKDLDMKKTVHAQATAFWYDYAKRKNLQKWRNVMVKAVNSRLNGTP